VTASRRVLHLGNILNNGYLNAKFLRRRGWAADSVTIDYRHVQAQPEWEEVPVVNPKLSHFDPDWSAIDLGGYERVDWFHDIDLKDVPRLAEAISLGRPSGRHGERLGDTSVRQSAPSTGLKRAAVRVLDTFGLGSFGRSAARDVRVRVLEATASTALQNLVQEFAAAYPDRADALTLHDIAEYRESSTARGPLFAQYPLVQAYSLDPIYVLLNDPVQPFICFEHGTMREFPFEDSARGRLYALALKRAERVFITNADCNRSAERLGLTNYTFVPHPVDENLYRPAESPLRGALQREHGCDYVFLAPARHHWKHCPPGLENSWLKRNDILIRALGRFFAAHADTRALVVFFEWGQEVDLSKQLIAECGFADRVRWEPIASKPVMREFYNAADIVFDQFNDGIGTFGTVVPEALASGKPVLLNYKKELHTWCFPELPPALNTSSEEAIERHIVDLLSNEERRREVGRHGREWFLRYHSSSLVAERMIDVYLEIAGRRGWEWRH
jgi:glycosyltransferase involved in cell wall biosynthesis